jgi:tetraacyldisaccharide 4'-kinase
VSARRGWAWPLVPVYAAGMAVKDGLRAAGVLPTKRLAWPVVSVGSLSAGGAGKTPVVIALAELLRGRGWDVDVLSRGYGREGRGVERVSSCDNAAASTFGDEPVLIAQRLRVPVWVGADRFAAGRASEVSGPATDVRRGVHLLDDGFQHRALARAMDVVLVTAEDLEDALLPAGNRREGLNALRRADAVVVREEQRGVVEPRIREWMRPDAMIWSVRRKLTFGDAEAGARPVAFCGIARPEGFWAMIAQAGCEVAETVAFGDHHRYGTADVERLLRVAADRGATGFITTEKDAVKLTPEMLAQLRTVGPLIAARLEAKFLDEADVVGAIEARIG